MIYEQNDNFYLQKLYLTNVREWRFEFFSSLCQNKKVLHIGCADAMAFKPESNLHIYLNNKGGFTKLDGLDIDIKTVAELQALCPGRYYTAYDQITEKYDFILIPEVIEHVPNVYQFLTNIFAISSNEYFFTVPSTHVAQIFCDDTYCLEIIHPDHKYWFSPYTIFNTIKPFSNGYDIKMYYLENKSQIGIKLCKIT